MNINEQIEVMEESESQRGHIRMTDDRIYDPQGCLELLFAVQESVTARFQTHNIV